MAKKVALFTLNGSTVDIMNVIRANASLAYQNTVPVVETVSDIPKVGEYIVGTPAFANEFINALLNRIALVRVKSATFNNPYAILKKGYLEYGETVEEIFVNIAKVFEFSAEKAEARELKQYKPDVKSAFHAMNWRVLYPMSISDMELRQAFLSADGVTNMIARIVDSMYTAAEYDEYLLFKYMLIKAVNNSAMYHKNVTASTTGDFAKAFRGISNMLPFMKREYNAAGVLNTTPRERQVIFMDAQFNANFDVDVLSAAFHMDKADFMGRLFLIDDWTTFDNERWSVIRAESDGLEEVTSAELTAMAKVTAILLDEDWFQVYDNLIQFSEKYVATGLRWNYFLHNWKTISMSPYANVVVFFNNQANSEPDTITFTIMSIQHGDGAAFVMTLGNAIGTLNSANPKPVSRYKFIQTADLTAAGIAIQPYGGVMYDGTTRTATDGDTLDLAVELYGNTYELEDALIFDGTNNVWKLNDTGEGAVIGAVGSSVNFT